MVESVTYPAVFDYSEEGYVHIVFPGFANCFTSVERDKDPVKAAQEVLALSIIDLEDNGASLPVPSNLVSTEPNKAVVYINLWMPYQRALTKETYTKKTLTIPTWLNMLATEKNVNFSAILVNGLKKHLGLIT